MSNRHYTVRNATSKNFQDKSKEDYVNRNSERRRGGDPRESAWMPVESNYEQSREILMGDFSKDNYCEEDEVWQKRGQNFSDCEKSDRQISENSKQSEGFQEVQRYKESSSQKIDHQRKMSRKGSKHGYHVAKSKGNRNQSSHGQKDSKSRGKISRKSSGDSYHIKKRSKRKSRKNSDKTVYDNSSSDDERVNTNKNNHNDKNYRKTIKENSEEANFYNQLKETTFQRKKNPRNYEWGNLSRKECQSQNVLVSNNFDDFANYHFEDDIHEKQPKTDIQQCVVLKPDNRTVKIPENSHNNPITKSNNESLLNIKDIKTEKEQAIEDIYQSLSTDYHIVGSDNIVIVKSETEQQEKPLLPEVIKLKPIVEIIDKIQSHNHQISSQNLHNLTILAEPMITSAASKDLSGFAPPVTNPPTLSKAVKKEFIMKCESPPLQSSPQYIGKDLTEHFKTIPHLEIFSNLEKTNAVSFKLVRENIKGNKFIPVLPDFSKF